jgi:hypothetical protein
MLLPGNAPPVFMTVSSGTSRTAASAFRFRKAFSAAREFLFPTERIIAQAFFPMQVFLKFFRAGSKLFFAKHDVAGRLARSSSGIAGPLFRSDSAPEGFLRESSTQSPEGRKACSLSREILAS